MPRWGEACTDPFIVDVDELALRAADARARERDRAEEREGSPHPWSASAMRAAMRFTPFGERGLGREQAHHEVGAASHVEEVPGLDVHGITLDELERPFLVRLHVSGTRTIAYQPPSTSRTLADVALFIAERSTARFLRVRAQIACSVALRVARIVGSACCTGVATER